MNEDVSFTAAKKVMSYISRGLEEDKPARLESIAAIIQLEYQQIIDNYKSGIDILLNDGDYLAKRLKEEGFGSVDDWYTHSKWIKELIK